MVLDGTVESMIDVFYLQVQKLRWNFIKFDRDMERSDVK